MIRLPGSGTAFPWMERSPGAQEQSRRHAAAAGPSGPAPCPAKSRQCEGLFAECCATPSQEAIAVLFFCHTVCQPFNVTPIGQRRVAESAWGSTKLVLCGHVRQWPPRPETSASPMKLFPRRNRLSTSGREPTISTVFRPVCRRAPAPRNSGGPNHDPKRTTGGPTRSSPGRCDSAACPVDRRRFPHTWEWEHTR